jgi:hypothetical protein
MIAVFTACSIVAWGQVVAIMISSLSEGNFWSDAIAFMQEKNGPAEFDFWKIVIFARLCDQYALRTGISLKNTVLIAWLALVAAGLYLFIATGLFAAYFVIPCWLTCGSMYVIVSTPNYSLKINGSTITVQRQEL